MEAHVEVAEPSARIDGLPHTTWHELPAGATPGDALVATIESLELDAGAKVWVAGEAAAVQRIRQHLFNQRGLPRSQAAIRGYWKHGRTGGDED